MKISFECSDLIEELKNDIKEFGESKMVSVWARSYSGEEVYVNYDFLVSEDAISKEQIRDDERIVFMEMSILLSKLEEQNSIF